MMIEPPGNLGRTGVFEIDDGVFITVEMRLVEERAGAMQQAGKNEFGVVANAFAIEAGKQCGGAGPVETLVVIENFDFQSIPRSLQKLSAAEG
jgi:hypothetical protein